MVESGEAVALCQATFRPVSGLEIRPLAGAPLRWRLLLGWHPEAVAAKFADGVLGHAVAAYEDTVGRNPLYQRWLTANPTFGSQQVAPI
jgi:hypothetical protein